jgi:hypothetical protein
MKEKLDALRGQLVTVFVPTLSGATAVFTGALIGGDFPGPPFGIRGENMSDAHFRAVVGFKPENVRNIEVRGDATYIHLH